MGMGVEFLEYGRELRLPGLLHTDDLVLFYEAEQDLKATVDRFVEVCRIRGLDFNED